MPSASTVASASVKETASPVSITTASFTPPANAVLYANIGMINFVGNTTLIPDGTTVTTSAGGLTWTRVRSARDTVSGYPGAHEVWWAVTDSAPPAMTLTFNAGGQANGADPAQVTIHVVAVTGDPDLTAPNGAVAAGAEVGAAAVTINLNNPPASTSGTLAFGFSADNGTTTTRRTPSAGWTELYDTGSPDAGYGDLQTMWRPPGSTSAAVTWDNFADNASASLWMSSAFAVEVKAAAGGGALQVRLFVLTPFPAAVQRAATW